MTTYIYPTSVCLYDVLGPYPAPDSGGIEMLLYYVQLEVGTLIQERKKKLFFWEKRKKKLINRMNK